MYMNTILPNIERRAFVESDAASRITKPGAGYDAAVASWRRDVMTPVETLNGAHHEGYRD